MDGMPRADSASTRGWMSSAPVRKPGMITAALMSGRGLFLLSEVDLPLLDEDDDNDNDDDDDDHNDDDGAVKGVTVSIDLAMSKRKNVIDFVFKVI